MNLIQFRDETVSMLKNMIDVIETPSSIKERDLRIDLLCSKLHHLRYLENEQFGCYGERDYSSLKRCQR